VSKEFTLGKNERLKSRKQIEKLFAEGKSFSVNPFRVYYLFRKKSSLQSSPDASGFNLQFGVGVSAKNFKKAVERNRIKRLTREAWRLQNSVLKQQITTLGKQLNVFIIYTGKDLPGFLTVKDKVAIALKKLSAKADENNTSNS
jgi:ribonuclease P protein component